jgi:tRNA U34 5-methylaminomethyl-2-thiouridine-forming methyltransferase MnmC
MKSPHSVPNGHKLVNTDDGSYTFFSEEFQEACHSISGAKSETVLHYIEGCQVLIKSQLYSPLIILEVGFGLGVGFLTTLEKLQPEAKLHFISLELDRNLLEWFVETHPEFKFSWKENILEAKSDFFEITIIQGDARIELPTFLSKNPIKWHAIYQDAFSPKKNPSLWTKEWFELLKQNSHEDVLLSTYSASTSIRKSMHESGWGVLKGEKFGSKRTSTRASLKEATQAEILEHLERSPVNALTDLQINFLLTK